MGRSVNWSLIRVLSIRSRARQSLGWVVVIVVWDPAVSASILLEMMKNCTSKQILDLYQFK